MDFIPNHSCVRSPDLCLIMYQQLPLPEPRDKAITIPALPCSNNPAERPCLTLCSKVCQGEHSLHGKQWDEVLETSSSCCFVMHGPKFQLGSACTSQAGEGSWTHRVVTALIGPSSTADLFQVRKSFSGKVAQHQDCLLKQFTSVLHVAAGEVHSNLILKTMCAEKVWDQHHTTLHC